MFNKKSKNVDQLYFRQKINVKPKLSSFYFSPFKKALKVFIDFTMIVVFLIFLFIFIQKLTYFIFN